MLSRRLHIFLVLLQLLTLCQLPASAAPAGDIAPTDAKLTEAHGDVYKRSFTDWTKEALGDPTPATAGEVLHEGMQIGTGEKSWAQMQWQHVSARAWANSVYAIAPNQRLVYLVSGEMLYQLDKKRPDKSPYFVWTNLLQARIRGTTVMFQANKTTSRISVLEGTVEVLNKLDRSVVALQPGAVYEISQKPAAGETSTTPATPLPNISLTNTPASPVFETSKGFTTVSAIDPKLMLDHPLVRGFDSVLPSLALVTDALNGVASKLEGVTKGVTGTVASLLHDALTITSVPRALSYNVGSEIRNIAQVAPGTFDFFQPEGLIGQLTAATPQNVIVNGGTTSGGVGELLNHTTNNLQNITGVPTGALGNTVGSTVAGVGGLTAATGASLSSTVNSLTSVTSATRGLVTGLPVVGPVVSPVTTGLTNTLNNTLTGVGNTVGGTLGGLGGLLGGH